MEWENDRMYELTPGSVRNLLGHHGQPSLCLGFPSVKGSCCTGLLTSELPSSSLSFAPSNQEVFELWSGTERPSPEDLDTPSLPPQPRSPASICEYK